MNSNSPDFPIMYDGFLYEKEDCHQDFLELYEGKFMLQSDGGIYITEGMCIFPDGTTGGEL